MLCNSSFIYTTSLGSISRISPITFNMYVEWVEASFCFPFFFALDIMIGIKCNLKEKCKRQIRYKGINLTTLFNILIQPTHHRYLI